MGSGDMLQPSKSAHLKNVVAIALVIILLTFKNVIGRQVRARRLSVPLYPRATESQKADQVRLRRTLRNDITVDDYIRPERHALRGDRWINGIVPYTIDPKFNSTERALISKAFEEYANKTCIRFVPKTSKYSDYVDIQLDNKECGLSNICRNGGKQFAKIGRKCMNLNTILHELGHSICLAHEHTRMDREDFIELTNNSDKNDLNNQVGDWRFTTLGLLYDYESVMHYDCPYFFKPKSAATINCGKTQRLSVLDAEKINSLYDCGGCHSYRFRPLEHAGNNVADLGYDVDAKKLGVCRGYLNGDIIPGKYRLGSGECHIPYKLKEYILVNNFEVLTLPKPKYFSWKYVKNGKIPKNAVPGGRENGGVPLYIGRCFAKTNGQFMRAPGKVHHAKFYFAFRGKEYTCSKFEILVCNVNA